MIIYILYTDKHWYFAKVTLSLSPSYLLATINTLNFNTNVLFKTQWIRRIVYNNKKYLYQNQKKKNLTVSKRLKSFWSVMTRKSHTQKR